MPTGGDKWLHFIVYGILGVLVARAAELSPRRIFAVATVILAVSIFGALDEAHQAFIPGRFPDVRDWMADTIGGALGAIAITLFGKRWLSARSLS